MMFRQLRSDWPYLLVALAGGVCIFVALVTLGAPKLTAELLALFIATVGYGWALLRRDEPELSKTPGAFWGILLGSLILLAVLVVWRVVGRGILNS